MTFDSYPYPLVINLTPDRRHASLDFFFGLHVTFNVSVPASFLKPKDLHSWCPFRRDGEKTVSRMRHLSEGYYHHICQKHRSITVPETGTRDLTGMIVKTHAYPVAHGGFSDVWCCQLRSARTPLKRVAVKAIRNVMSSDEEYQIKKKAVEQELRIWVTLDHRNVLPLLGTTHGFGRFTAFVCPWAVHGTLSEYLEKFETQLDLKKRLALLEDVAAGLQYLHSQQVVHGDLSGANILIDEDGRACLSDFGLSTLVEQVSGTTLSGLSFPGNIRWAAPELLDECGKGRSALQLSSQQADVYSFGRVMLQILTGKLPFHRIRRVAEIVIMMARGERLPREPRWDGKAIPDVLWTFVEACWARPAERPSSREIVAFIRKQKVKW